MRKRAFTLIEVLITTSLMVVIAGLTVGIFTGIAQFQVNRRSAQAFAAEQQQFEEQIRLDFTEMTAPVFTYVIRNLNNNPSNPGLTGDLLAVRKAVRQVSGTTAYEWRFYCRNSETETILRTRVPLITATPELSTLQGIPALCNGASLRNLVSVPGGSTGDPVVDQLVRAGGGVDADVLRFTRYYNQIAGGTVNVISHIRVDMSARLENNTTTSHRFHIAVP